MRVINSHQDWLPELFGDRGAEEGFIMQSAQMHSSERIMGCGSLNEDL